MEISLLLQYIAILSLMLLLLVAALLNLSRKTKKKEKHKFTFEDSLSIINNSSSSSKELENALNLIIKHNGKITAKIEFTAHPESNKYMDVLMKVCIHPNTNKNVILKFNKSLEKLNPTYKKEINSALMMGLDARGE